MSRKFFRVVGLALFFLLVPYVFTLAFSKREQTPVNEFQESGRQIVLGDGEQRVDLEQFVLYMAAAQVPVDYGPETLKCQAVIARTYLYRELGDNLSATAKELQAAYLDEEGMQKLWGKDYSENRRQFEAAVLATEGQTLRYEGEYILAVFHRMSAGMTRSGGETFPYLKSMDASEDIQANGYLQAITYSLKEVAETLAAGTGRSLAPERFLAEVQIVKRDAAGYVEQVQIGAGVYAGDAVASQLGLPSPCFQWEAYQGGLRIICKGQGHGYGLSQWGARAKEERGYTYKEILQFYFPGTEIR